MMNETEIYNCLFQFRKPLIEKIITELNIPVGSNGLDAGCGIGSITNLLAKRVGKNGFVTGVDLSKKILSYAEKYASLTNTGFVQGDINNLPFDENTFDWIWSIDTVWPGPKEMECPAENPSGILAEYSRVLKPGGRLYLLYWTSQKLLPGYPLLEARLNATSIANAPFTNNTPPSNHVMNAKDWLVKAGFKSVSAKTFVGDISAPLTENDKKALKILTNMLWGRAEKELTGNDWEKMNDLCFPISGDSLFDLSSFYGFYTYSLFKGIHGIH